MRKRELIKQSKQLKIEVKILSILLIWDWNGFKNNIINNKYKNKVACQFNIFGH